MSEDSVFDPNTFLTTETEAVFETRMPLIPEAKYPFIISDCKPERSQKGKPMLVFSFEMVGEQVDQLKSSLGLPYTPKLREYVVVEVENGKLATGPGKNVRLGRILEAFGMNGKRWTPSTLKGIGPATLTVGTRTDDNGEPQNQVNRYEKFGA